MGKYDDIIDVTPESPAPKASKYADILDAPAGLPKTKPEEPGVSYFQETPEQQGPPGVKWVPDPDASDVGKERGHYEKTYPTGLFLTPQQQAEADETTKQLHDINVQYGLAKKPSQVAPILSGATTPTPGVRPAPGASSDLPSAIGAGFSEASERSATGFGVAAGVPAALGRGVLMTSQLPGMAVEKIAKLTFGEKAVQDTKDKLSKYGYVSPEDFFNELKNPTAVEQWTRERQDMHLKDDLVQGGIPLATAYGIASGIEETALNLAIPIGIMGLGAKAVAKTGQLAPAFIDIIKHGAKEGAKWAGFTFATTPGDVQEKTTAAVHTAAFMMIPALGSGISQPFLRKFITTAGIAGFNAPSYINAVSQADELAREHGGTREQWLAKTITPQVLTDGFFGIRTPGMAEIKADYIKELRRVNPALADQLQRGNRPPQLPGESVAQPPPLPREAKAPELNIAQDMSGPEYVKPISQAKTPMSQEEAAQRFPQLAREFAKQPVTAPESTQEAIKQPAPAQVPAEPTAPVKREISMDRVRALADALEGRQAGGEERKAINPDTMRKVADILDVLQKQPLPSPAVAETPAPKMEPVMAKAETPATAEGANIPIFENSNAALKYGREHPEQIEVMEARAKELLAEQQDLMKQKGDYERIKETGQQSAFLHEAVQAAKRDRPYVPGEEPASAANPRELMTPGEEMKKLAIQTQVDAGWNPDWPIIPADLMDVDKVDAIKIDPSLSETEKTALLSFTPGGAGDVAMRNRTVRSPAPGLKEKWMNMRTPGYVLEGDRYVFKGEKPAPEKALAEPQKAGGISYDQFAKEYRDAFNNSMKYKPDEVGSQFYTEKMSNLADDYPKHLKRFEIEEEAKAKPTLADINEGLEKPTVKVEPTHEPAPAAKTPEKPTDIILDRPETLSEAKKASPQEITSRLTLLQEKGAAIHSPELAYLTDKTDLDSLASSVPDMRVYIKDANGQRASMPMKDFVLLNKIQAFSDRIRIVEVSPELKASKIMAHEQFMDGTLKDIAGRRTLDEKTSLLSVEPIPGVTLNNNASVRIDRRNNFQRAVIDPTVRELLQELGITNVDIEPPYKFSLSEQGHITKDGKTIRLNADATDPKQTMMHELGHRVEERMSKSDRARLIADATMGDHPSLRGYAKLQMDSEIVAEAFAQGIVTKEGNKYIYKSKPAKPLAPPKKALAEPQKAGGIAELKSPGVMSKAEMVEELAKNGITSNKLTGKMVKNMAKADVLHLMMQKRYELKPKPTTAEVESSLTKPTQKNRMQANERNRTEAQRTTPAGEPTTPEVLSGSESAKRLAREKQELERRAEPIDDNLASFQEDYKLIRMPKKGEPLMEELFGKRAKGGKFAESGAIPRHKFRKDSSLQSWDEMVENAKERGLLKQDEENDFDKIGRLFEKQKTKGEVEDAEAAANRSHDDSLALESFAADIEDGFKPPKYLRDALPKLYQEALKTSGKSEKDLSEKPESSLADTSFDFGENIKQEQPKVPAKPKVTEQNLIPEEEIPFNLQGEAGIDTERIVRDKEAKVKAQEKMDKAQQDMFAEKPTKPSEVSTKIVPRVGDEVSWTDPTGFKTKVTILKIEPPYGEQKEPLAQIEYFGTKYRPLSEFTVIRSRKGEQEAFKAKLQAEEDANKARRDKPTKDVGATDKLQQIADKLPGANIKIVDTEADLPEGLRSRQGGKTEGVYSEGVSYIVRENVKPGDEVRVITHEAVIHGGLRAIMPEAELTKVLENTYLNKEQHVDAVLSKMRERNIGKTEAVEEIIADIWSNKQANPSMWNKLVASMRNGLRKLGFDIEWSENDIENLIARASKRLSKPMEGGTGPTRYSKAKSNIDRDRIKELGYTNNPKEAGYLTPDAKMIDLSGKKEGGQPRNRSLDHREVGGTEGMLEFMSEGNIRMDPNFGTFNISKQPTSKQESALIDLFGKHLGGQDKNFPGVTLDLEAGLGEWNAKDERYREPARRFAKTYPDNEKPERIIADIRKFFNGEMPDPIITRFSKKAEEKLPPVQELKKVGEKKIEPPPLPSEKKATEDISPDDPIGISNAKARELLLEAGREDVPKPERRADEQVVDDALKEIELNPARPNNLVQELIHKPREISDTEHALLDYAMVEKVNRFRRAKDEYIASQESGGLDAETARNIGIRAELAADAMYEVALAAKHAGTATARSLRFRQRMFNEDFSMEALEIRRRGANNSKPLTKEQQAENQKFADKDAKMTQDIKNAEYEKQNAKLIEQEKRISKIIDDFFKTQAKGPDSKAMLDIARQQSKEAMEFLKSTGIKVNDLSTIIRKSEIGGELTDKQIDALSKIGAEHIFGGAKDRTAWEAKMRLNFGNQFDARMGELYNKSFEKYMEIRGQAKPEKTAKAPVTDAEKYLAHREKTVDKQISDLKQKIEDLKSGKYQIPEPKVPITIDRKLQAKIDERQKLRNEFNDILKREKQNGKHWVEAVNELLNEKKITLPPEIKQAIEAKLIKASKIYDVKARNEAVNEAVTELNKHVSLNAGEWFESYVYTNMLSGPRTSMRNIHGNLVNTFLTRPLSLVVQGEFRGAGRYLREATRLTFNGDAMHAAVEAFRRGEESKLSERISEISDNPNDVQAFKSLIEHQKRLQGPNNPIAKKVWKAVSVSNPLMNAQDVFSGYTIYHAEKARLLEKGMSEDRAHDRALTLANEYLYRNKLQRQPDKSLDMASFALEGVGAHLDAMRSLLGESIGGRAVKMVTLPFLRTLVNIAKFNSQLSAVGFMGTNKNNIANAHFKESFDSMKKRLDVEMNRPSRNMEEINTLEKQIESVERTSAERYAKAAIGTTISLLGWIAAANGNVQLQAPKDKKARTLFYDAGHRAWSVEIAGHSIPLLYLGPAMLSFALPAIAMQKLSEDPESADNEWYRRIGRFSLATSMIYLDQLPFQTIKKISDATTGRESNAWEQILGRAALQATPYSGMLSWITSIVDPTNRKTTTVGDTIKAGIPGLSDSVQAYKTSEGLDAKKDIIDAFMPYTVGKIKESKKLALEKSMQELKERNQRKAIEKQKTLK